MRFTRAHAAVAFLVPGAVVAGGLIAAPASAATTITVCATGCDQTTISAAVAAATAGDSIEVRGGTYAESVLVDKSLTLTATPGTTVLPGPSYNDAGFRLAADDITIQGFTVGNRSAMSQTVGIDVSGTARARLVDNILVNNQRGISLSGAEDVVVDGNRVADNNGSGPDNNAGLWGDSVDGILIENSTFLGHTNTAINLAGSQDIDIVGNRFEDNGNLAVIWNDSDVTIADNTGTMMRSSGVYLNQSTDVTVSGNDLSARATSTSGVSVSNASGANSQVTVSDNALRGFARAVNVGSGAAADSVVVEGNQLLGATGVRNQGTVPVDARGNWWGDASGPTAASNPTGTGAVAEGDVAFDDWCVVDTCVDPEVPPTKVATSLTGTVVAKRDGDRVLRIAVQPEGAEATTVEGGAVLVRREGKPTLRLTVKQGKVRANLGNLRPGKHVYTVVFRGTELAKRATTTVTVKVR